MLHEMASCLSLLNHIRSLVPRVGIALQFCSLPLHRLAIALPYLLPVRDRCYHAAIAARLVLVRNGQSFLVQFSNRLRQRQDEVRTDLCEDDFYQSTANNREQLKLIRQELIFFKK